MKKKLIISFIILSIIIVGLLNYEKEKKINNQINNQIKRYSNLYKSVDSQYKQKNKDIIDDNNKKILLTTYSIINEMMNYFHITPNIIIYKNIIDDKKFKFNKTDYIQSSFKEFYFNKEIMTKMFEYNNKHKLLAKSFSKETSLKIKQKKPFYIYDKSIDKLFIFLPIVNHINTTVIASIIMCGDTFYIKNKTLNFNISASLIVLFLATIFYIIYRESISKDIRNDNNEKLKTVIQEADSGIAIMDLDGNFLEVNYLYTELLGYTIEEFKTLNCIDLTVDIYKEEALTVLREAKKEGSISKFRKKCLNKDGTMVELELSLNLLPNKKTFVAVINSLEDKIKMEQSLQKFEHIFNFTSVGFLIVDDKRDIIDINPKLCKMLGYNKEQLIDQNARVLHIDEKHYEDYGERIFSKAKLQEIVRIEFELQKLNGSTIWCEISGAPMDRSAKLKRGGVLWAIIDISEKVMAERMIIKQNDKLSQLNKNLNDEVKNQIDKLRKQDDILAQQTKMAMMGEMIDAVAHQWKQPLSAISISAQDIELKQEMGIITPEDVTTKSVKIIEQVDHLTQTIDEFRGFFRPKTNVELVNIQSVIDGVLLLLKDVLIANNIEVNCIGDKSIDANIIPNEFKHVLINLINNSKDEFISKNIEIKTIKFELEKDYDNIILKVSDNAGGIPQDIIPHIFEANITTKEKGKGTGIGLYMTKNIIEKIGGTIVANNHLHGAEFIVSIPCE